MAAPAPPAAAAPGAPAARPAARDTARVLAFAGLPWDAPPPEVARRLGPLGFARAGEGTWRGPAFGRRAALAPEYDAAGRLVAVTLAFAPDGRGSATQRFSELADAMRRRHGPWLVRVGPGRPVTETRTGRLAVVRTLGERVAAAFWTDVAGGAAVVQLAAGDTLWLRYESPRWPATRPAAGDAE